MRATLQASPLTVAPRLLGARLTSVSPQGTVTVRLTEVEAYRGSVDPGSHAFRGPTPRNAVMFGDAGHLYVYFTYGMHWCANVVCGPSGEAGAVLMRAGEVVHGADLSVLRRPTARRQRDLARGPANLASALGLSGVDNGTDLLAADARISLTLPARRPPARFVRTGPRVGLREAAELPWRFWIDGDPSVSAYRPAAPRPERR